jgi:hypothetical protein
VSRYLELARQAATREGLVDRTGECPKKEEATALRSLDKSRSLVREASGPEEEPYSRVPNRNRNDQSPDYQAVLKVLREPPYWLRGSYMVGYRNGTVTLFALSAAVAAALGRSPYGWTERLMPLVRQALGSKALSRDRASNSNVGFESGAKGRG